MSVGELTLLFEESRGCW